MKSSWLFPRLRPWTCCRQHQQPTRPGAGGFMYAQHARKASVATEAAAGGGGPIAFINKANKHEQPMVADLPQTTNISTAAAVDVLQAAPATDSAKYRTAPCSAAAAAREDLVEYLASQ
eukprot:6502806-Heterocapsa_arctica.AAC.1